MRHLGALGDVRVLDLHERTGLGVGADPGARAQVGERADGGAGGDRRPNRDRVQDGGAVAELAVADRGVRADVARLADRGAALELAAGLDHGAGADPDVDVGDGASWVDDRDARAQVVLGDPALRERAHLGEAHLVVDAEADGRVSGLVRGDPLAGGAQQRQRVGQVQLALRVVGLETAKHLEQRGAVEAEHAG